MERLQTIQGPTTDLPSLDSTGMKFSGRSRLYIGNLSNDITEESLKQMLTAFGEVGEIFYNREKKFAFLRMGTKYEAEKAKRELDGQVKSGQAIKVRFAPHQAAIKVQNLGPWVSNELLHKAFSIYGDIERAMVFVDDRGRTKGEGIVEFVRKPSALEAVKRCTECCYFLTASIRPVIAELDESTEDDDGLQEKMLIKRNQDYQFEREVG
jgi:proline- and glutamine-rich splicing factor